ncbi:MAG: hypothetical protein RL020_1403, partial [Pseudomonadota bacterium]
MPLNPPITEWNNLRVWIIGASTGIGAALTKALLEKNARVAVSSRKAEILNALVKGHEKNALVLPLDLTVTEQISAAQNQLVKTWGGVDLVLYVAGDHKPMRAWD